MFFLEMLLHNHPWDSCLVFYSRQTSAMILYDANGSNSVNLYLRLMWCQCQKEFHGTFPNHKAKNQGREVAPDDDNHITQTSIIIMSNKGRLPALGLTIMIRT